MLKDNETKMNLHRTMATAYLRSAEVYKALGNREMFTAKMLQYEKEMREVVRYQVAMKAGA